MPKVVVCPHLTGCKQALLANGTVLLLSPAMNLLWEDCRCIDDKVRLIEAINPQLVVMPWMPAYQVSPIMTPIPAPT